jgi:hypothetical protein
VRWYIEVTFRDYGGEEKVEAVPISDNEAVARVAYEQARADWNAGGVVGIRAGGLHDWLVVAADRVLEIRFLTFEELVE